VIRHHEVPWEVVQAAGRVGGRPSTSFRRVGESPGRLDVGGRHRDPFLRKSFSRQGPSQTARCCTLDQFEFVSAPPCSVSRPTTSLWTPEGLVGRSGPQPASSFPGRDQKQTGRNSRPRLGGVDYLEGAGGAGPLRAAPDVLPKYESTGFTTGGWHGLIRGRTTKSLGIRSRSLLVNRNSGPAPSGRSLPSGRKADRKT